LQLLLQHIPDKHEHTVQCYGAYSSRYRGQHGVKESSEPGTISVDEPDTDIRRAARATWAKLIYRVYQVDPLKCINGDQQMRIVALIHDPAVIRRILERRILEHLKLGDPESNTVRFPISLERCHRYTSPGGGVRGGLRPSVPSLQGL